MVIWCTFFIFESDSFGGLLRRSNLSIECFCVSKLFTHVVMVISVFTNLPKILKGSYEGVILIVCLDSGHCGEHIVEIYGLSMQCMCVVICCICIQGYSPWQIGILCLAVGYSFGLH